MKREIGSKRFGEENGRREVEKGGGEERWMMMKFCEVFAYLFVFFDFIFGLK